MSIAIASTVLEAPSGPKRVSRHTVAAGDPGRVAAFVFELDLLFDAARYETALARAVARSLALSRRLDPLWTEVVALEIARVEGARAAIESMTRLAGAPVPTRGAATTVPVGAVGDGTGATLRAIRHRFKLGLISRRPHAEASRIATDLGIAGQFEALVAPEAEAGAVLCPSVIGRLGEPADACVLVAPAGSPSIADARAAGMRSVAVGRSRSEHPATEPDLRLPSFDLIETLAAGANAKYSPGEPSGRIAA